MNAWRQLTVGTALLALAGLTACEEEVGLLGPGAALSDVEMFVSTSETWGERTLMIVGEKGHVSVSCHFGHSGGGACSQAPAFATSAPNVISITEFGTSTAALTAHAPGTATISATVDIITRTVTIEVLAEPLPIDDLRLSLVQPETWCPECQVTYDGEDRLETILMPSKTSLPFVINATREGESVGLRAGHSTTDAGTAFISEGCRPREVDSECSVHSSYWLNAESFGTADLTVTVRNLTVALEVQVLDSL